MQGRVIKGIGGFYYVRDGKNVYMGKARGNLKRGKGLLYVGDLVEYELDDNEQCVVTKVIERENFLIRPPVSNLEMLVVVFAAAQPDVNSSVIDKLIAACEQKGIEVAICITKKDLQTEEQLQRFIETYSSVYPVITVNGMSGEGISDLYEIIRGKNVALGGPSGVGKSTILNNLIGQGTMETGTISDKTGRGRHTTRHVEIFAMQDGTNVYDTPGFTSLELSDLEKNEVSDLFPEFRMRKGACKYANCIHVNEPECAVKEALANGEIPETRYQSYLQILNEVKTWH